MHYYENIEFKPVLKLDMGKKATRGPPFAWLEAVACTILNHTKEDCCITLRKVMELLIEAGRTDLLPGDQTGKKAEEINVGSLLGTATNMVQSVMRSRDHMYCGQIGIIINYMTVPPPESFFEVKGDKPAETEAHNITFYYFHLNPKETKKMFKEGNLKSKKYKPWKK